MSFRKSLNCFEFYYHSIVHKDVWSETADWLTAIKDIQMDLIPSIEPVFPELNQQTILVH